MNYTGTIAGIECAFGARWDDAKDSARLKTKFSDTVGYYDSKAVTKKHVPAPAVVDAMIDTEDKMAAYTVFYHDDEGEIFGSIIYSAGQIAPLSETIYESSNDWILAIGRATADSNIDKVYFPLGTVEISSDKHSAYEIATEVDKKSLPQLTSSSSIGTIIIVLLMVLVLAAIPIGAWIFIAKPFEKATTEVQFVVEKIKPNYTKVLEQCKEDLNEPWPAPPEWTLRQEGCVGAPELAKIAFPKPTDQRPYAYRFYDLNTTEWDDYLSRAAFLKMAERFPGQLLEGTNQFVLYMPYDIERDTVDDAYLPDTDPIAIVRSNFVGAVKLSGNAGVGGTSAFTDLELSRVLSRLSETRVTPNHIFRVLDNQQTGMEIGPERLETRQVRVE
ncbi:hypothetical protein ACGYLO_18105 [Sulfitobacter sp. 1A13353]|jgi:hypothetical protein|uniref:hypothetical protein n=1 Tax=Sulfitobacter sp. 1A13353 TaxID=3368568 RepID=UPI0037469835